MSNEIHLFLFVSDVFKSLNDLASFFPLIYFDSISWASIYSILYGFADSVEFVFG